MPKHVDVVIATPGHSMDSAYVQSLVQTIQFLSANQISFHVANKYSSRVAAAREATAMDSYYLSATCKVPFLGEITYNKIFWIDSDISWTVDDFMRLYNSQLDIVSGLYGSDRGVPMFSPLPDSAQSVGDIISNKQIVEVFAVGFGFICVKNGVFENMSRPWFADKFSAVRDEESGQDVYIPYGEDYSWCVSAREAGFKINLDPNARVTHHKKVDIRL